MRSWRQGRLRLVSVTFAAALLSAACFGGGGGGGQSAQATPTGATVAATSAPSPSPGTGVRPPGAVPSPGASPSPARASGPEQTYTIESGDTLATIAQKFYGDSSQWRKIYDANRAAIGDNPDAVKVGTQLRIPPKE